MELLRPLWLGFGAAALVLVAAGGLRRSVASGAPVPMGRMGHALIPCVQLAAYFGLKGRLPLWPGVESLDWAVWGSVALGILGWANPERHSWRLGESVCVALILSGFIMFPLQASLPLWNWAGLGAVAGLLFFAWALSVRARARLNLGHTCGIIWGTRMLLVTIGATWALSHSFVGAALLTSALGPAIGGSLVFQWRTRRDPFAVICLPWGVSFGALLLAGAAYGETPLLTCAALWLALFNLPSVDGSLASGEREKGFGPMPVWQLAWTLGWVAFAVVYAEPAALEYGYSPGG